MKDFQVLCVMAVMALNCLVLVRVQGTFADENENTNTTLGNTPTAESERGIAMEELEKYTYWIKHDILIGKKGHQISPADRQTIFNAVSETIKWMHDVNHKLTTDDLKRKKKEIEDIVGPIVKELNL